MASDVSSAEITEEFPQICGVPTPLLKCGQLNEQSTSLAIIIPGNPGVPDYYRDFMRHLHAASGATSLPVWCVGHAGHGRLPSHLPAPKPSKDMYSLQGQIQHKVTLIQQLVPSNLKILLIGHSIGSYMILHMLDHLISTHHSVHKCYLLFPTVEGMALSPKGLSATPMLRYLRWAAPLAMILPYYFIPDTIKGWLISWFAGATAVEGTVRLADPTSIAHSVNLAHEEMRTVVGADYSLIERHAKKLLWFYGANDHWCPLVYYERMKSKYPSMDVRLADAQFEHAFVLKSSEQVALQTWEWIEEHLEKAISD